MANIHITVSAKFDIDGEIEAQFNPHTAVAAKIAIALTGTDLEVSAGLTAKPSFQNTFTVTASTDAACQVGLSAKSEFLFDLTASATGWGDIPIYNLDPQLVSESCYNPLAPARRAIAFSA